MYFKDSLPVITCTNTENIASSRFSTVAAVLKKSPPLGKVQNWAGDLPNWSRELTYQDLLTVMLLATDISILLKASISVSLDKAP